MIYCSWSRGSQPSLLIQQYNKPEAAVVKIYYFLTTQQVRGEPKRLTSCLDTSHQYRDYPHDWMDHITGQKRAQIMTYCSDTPHQCKPTGCKTASPPTWVLGVRKSRGWATQPPSPACSAAEILATGGTRAGSSCVCTSICPAVRAKCGGSSIFALCCVFCVCLGLWTDGSAALFYGVPHIGAAWSFFMCSMPISAYGQLL